jgi:hypothetical protein
MLIRGRFLALAAILTVSTLAGCGSGGNTKKGSVKGSVKVDGVAANSGNVTFTIGSDKISGAIDGEGNYRVVGMPPGEAKVTVENLHLPKTEAPVTPGMPGASVGKPVPIPTKYAKPETSGLSHTVTNGETTFDLTLSK